MALKSGLILHAVLIGDRLVKGWQPPRVITGLVPVIPIARSAAPFLSGWPGMRIRKKRTPQPKDGVHARLRPGRRDSRRGKIWGHGALAKPCRSARKATDGVRLSRRCSPFRGIAGPGGSLSWGKPSLQRIVRIRAERCAVCRGERGPERANPLVASAGPGGPLAGADGSPSVPVRPAICLVSSRRDDRAQETDGRASREGKPDRLARECCRVPPQHLKITVRYVTVQ